MRAIQHAFLSLTRKPTKAIMIFAILFLVFTLIFTGLIIQNSVTESKKFIRKELGAEVTFRVNYQLAELDDLYDTPEGQEKLKPTKDLLDALSGDSRIKATYLTSNSDGKIQNAWSGRYFKDKKSFEEEKEWADDDPDYKPTAYANFTGVNNPVPLDFENSKYKIVDGTLFTQEQLDNAEKVTVVSKDFAEINNLKIGDTITFRNDAAFYNVTYSDHGRSVSYEGKDEDESNFMEDLTIIGIYGEDKEKIPPYQTDNMYIPLNYSTSLTDNSDFSYFSNDTTILLKDPLDVDGFIKDNKDKLPNKYLELYSNDHQFKSLTAPLNLLDTISKIFISVIFIAGSLIILSIVTMFVRDRKFEVGLLLASGESKFKIISQFILEILIVAILAFGLSAVVSQFSSSYIGSWIAENQLTSEDEEIEKKLQEKYENSDEYYYNNGPQLSDVREDFSVGLDSKSVLKILFSSFGIIFIAASIPLIVILSYKPREALQD